jgi:hypothetical protein
LESAFLQALMRLEIVGTIDSRMAAFLSDDEDVSEYGIAADLLGDPWNDLLNFSVELALRVHYLPAEETPPEAPADDLDRVVHLNPGDGVDLREETELRPVMPGRVREKKPSAARAGAVALEETASRVSVESLRVMPDTLPDFPDVATAVTWASDHSPHLVFDAACARGAESSTYKSPRRAAADILMLNGLAEAWQAGRITGISFTLAAGELFGASYRTGVSQTAVSRYPEDYVRTWNGQQITLGPHVARVGRGRGAWRLYWYVDTTQTVIYVGWLGTKLRDLTYSGTV